MRVLISLQLGLKSVGSTLTTVSKRLTIWLQVSGERSKLLFAN